MAQSGPRGQKNTESAWKNWAKGDGIRYFPIPESCDAASNMLPSRIGSLLVPISAMPGVISLGIKAGRRVAGVCRRALTSGSQSKTARKSCG